jgi:hypothetical protein
MDKVIQRILGCSITSAIEFVQKAEKEGKHPVKVIDQWTDDTRPDGVYVNEEWLHHARCQMDLGKWAERHQNCALFLSNASLFEFKVAFHVNPYYPLLAFQVPFDACVEFMRQYDLRAPPDATIHALIMQEIRHSKDKCVAVTKMRELLDAYGLDYRDPCTLRPFGPDVFKDHLLEKVSPWILTPGEILKSVKGCTMEHIRERKEMTNKLMECTVDGKQVIKVRENISGCVRLLKALQSSHIKV